MTPEELETELERLEPRAGPAGTLSPAERARTGARLAETLAAVATSAPDPRWFARLPSLHPRLGEALARNPHLPPDWQLPLARSASGLTHAALAARSDLSVEVLLALLDSPEPTVRSRVLGDHPDPALLRVAASHGDPWLRAAAAAREDLPLETLSLLASDADTRVRRRVAENPATPTRILMRLGRDDDAGVRKSARAHPRWAPGWWERWWGRQA